MSMSPELTIQLVIHMHKTKTNRIKTLSLYGNNYVALLTYHLMFLLENYSL